MSQQPAVPFPSFSPRGRTAVPPPPALFWISIAFSLIAGIVGLILCAGFVLVHNETFAVLGVLWLYVGGFLAFAAMVLAFVYVGISISRGFAAGAIVRCLIALALPPVDVAIAIVCAYAGITIITKPAAPITSHSLVGLSMLNLSDNSIDRVVAMDGSKQTELGTIKPYARLDKSVTLAPGNGSVELEITSGGRTWRQPAVENYIDGHTDNGYRFLELKASPAATKPASAPATRAIAPEDAAQLHRLGWRDAGAHDPSTIVRDGDWFYCFVTGQGIGVARSRDLQTWTPLAPVFNKPPTLVANAVPGNRGHYWAPDIIKGSDGRWRLYYSISTFGKNTSAIALATNKTLDPDSPDFEWKDEGVVFKSTSTDHFNAIDPAVTIDADGRHWMAFGSFWDGIKLIELDPANGFQKDPSVAPTAIARNKEIEAAFIYRHDDRYYLFVNWGLCCRGVKSTYEIRIGRSNTITGPYYDRDGKDLASGGGTPFLASDGPVVGPGHAGIFIDRDGHEQLSFHLYDGTNDGKPMLGIRPLSWDADGWPVAQERK